MNNKILKQILKAIQEQNKFLKSRDNLSKKRKTLEHREYIKSQKMYQAGSRAYIAKLKKQ